MTIRKTLLTAALLACLASECFPASPQQADTPLNRGLKNYANGHYRKAFQYFEEARKAGVKEEEEKFLNYAIEKLKRNEEYFQAIEKGELRFRARKDDAVLAKELALLHRALAARLMEGKFYLSTVEPHLKRSCALDPEEAAGHILLGHAYYWSMRYADAADAFQKAIDRKTGDLSAYRMAGDSCVALGDYDRAKKYYGDLIQKSGEAPSGYDPKEIEKVKGVMGALPETYEEISRLVREERLDEAEATLKNRLSLNPSDYVAMTHLGIIYQDKGDRKTALRLFRSAVKAAPDYPIAHLYLGRLHYLMRREDDALEELGLFKEKMKKLPAMSDETKALYIDSSYYLVEVYSSLKRYADVKAELDEILSLDKKQADAYYDLGIYYYVHEHSRPRAYQAFRKAESLDPGSGTARRARYAIEYMRNNPSTLFETDFSFIDREYRD